MTCSPGFFVGDKDMKKHLLFFSAIFFTCFLMTVFAAGETASGDELISLNVEQKPLGEVLAMITKITGHVFIIDSQLLDMPVSISVKEIPLHKALKLIFSDTNSAFIYKSDGKIKIIVYTETTEKTKGAGSQAAQPPPQPASSPATEQESDSSQETAPGAETDNASNGGNEGAAQPDEQLESTEEQTGNTAEGTPADQETPAEQGENTEETTQ
jgi:hypothetical protein